MAIYTAQGIGPQLIAALGLPPETNLVQIRVGWDEVAEVIVRYYPDEAAMHRCVSVLQEYVLVPRGAPRPVDDPREPLEPTAVHSAEKPCRGLR